MAFSAGAGAALSTRVGIDGMSAYLAGMRKIGDETDKTAKRMDTSLAGMGNKASEWGRKWTRNVTLPVFGFGAASVKMSKDFNSSMANVATMTDGSSKRINGLKRDVQAMAVASGKSTGDLADGMYQVLSAFGDTKDAVKQLDIANRASKAGMSTTTEAIDLLSAVTKGYGDTSLKAMQHASDLSFQTVKLGQTNFPQLAASLGRVVPLAADLGVKQEELFGVMATATGVTGKAAEVSTQYRGILQSLSAPTDKMSKLYEQLGVKNGKQLIQQKGFVETLKLITDAAQKTNTPLQDYIGSIEGQTLASALAGAQNDNLRAKIKAMGDVAGSTDQAFRAQTQGINKAGFEWEQSKQKITVAMQGIGDSIGPMAATVIGGIADMGAKFAALPQPIQDVTLGIAGIAAVVGPTLMVMGQLATSIVALRTAASALALGPLLASPLGFTVAAAGAAAVALGAFSLTMKGTKTDTENAKAALDAYNNTVDSMTGAMSAERNANLQVQQAKLQVKKATEATGAAVKMYGKDSAQAKEMLLQQRQAESQLDSAMNNRAKTHREANDAQKKGLSDAKQAVQAYKDAVANVDRARAALDKWKAAQKNGDAGAGKQVELWKKKLQDAEGAQKNATKAVSMFKDRMPEFERAVGKGSTKLDELKQILNDLPSNKTVTVTVKQKGHLTTNQFGGGLGVATNNTGGVVPGARRANKDSVLSYLTPGEYVIKRDAVDKLGVPFLNSLNGFNRGGLVAAQTRANIASNPALALRQANKEYRAAVRHMNAIAKGGVSKNEKDKYAQAKADVKAKADAVIEARRALATSAVDNRFANREAMISRGALAAQGTAGTADDLANLNTAITTNQSKLTALRARLKNTRDPAARKDIRGQINSAIEKQLQLEQQRNGLIAEQNRTAHEAALNRARDTMTLADANSAYAIALANSTGDITQKTNAINQALANEERRRQILNETLANTAQNDAERADLINQLAQSVDASTALKEQLKQNAATTDELISVQLDQAKRQAEIERNRANMSEAALRTFSGSGDIGQGGMNALRAGQGNAPQLVFTSTVPYTAEQARMVAEIVNSGAQYNGTLTQSYAPVQQIGA